MRIAIFHELHSGGARRSGNEFAKHLKKKHIVDLYIVDDKKPNKEKDNYTNIFYFKFLSKKWKGHDWTTRLYKDTIELIKLYFLHKAVAKVINSKKYDVVFVQPSQFTQAPFILQFLKTPTTYLAQEVLRMVYEPGLGIPKNLALHKYLYENAIRLIRKYIDKTNIEKAKVVLANSRFSQKNIKKAYGIDSEVVYMGVDTSVFKPLKTSKEYDVLFAGAYEVIDGYPLLEEIKKKLPPKITMKILASEKQWNFTDQDIRKLYAKSKVVLALAHNEPLGLIPLEAMACEIPVIAVREGGYKETVIDNKTGFLVRRNADMLSEKIKKLLGNALLRKRMGENAREAILKKWTWTENTKKLEVILKKTALSV